MAKGLLWDQMEGQLRRGSMTQCSDFFTAESNVFSQRLPLARAPHPNEGEAIIPRSQMKKPEHGRVMTSLLSEGSYRVSGPESAHCGSQFHASGHQTAMFPECVVNVPGRTFPEDPTSSHAVWHFGTKDRGAVFSCFLRAESSHLKVGQQKYVICQYRKHFKLPTVDLNSEF